MAKAILFNKYKPLLELEIEKENAKVTKVYRILDELCLPIVLQGEVTIAGINDWITKRLIPDKRDGLALIKRRYPAFSDYNNMFSLSDQYWFQFKENESWDKLNFFTNPYAEDFGKLFFSPWEANENNLGAPTPDKTTNGVLRKRWVKEGDGHAYLIKAGSKIYHQEPLSEVLASIILERLDLLPFVKYELVVDGLRLCSKCRNFIDKNTEFVPASYIYTKVRRKENETVYEHLLKMCGQYGIPGAKEYIDNMITADKIIGNDDRHLGNFGFIRDATTGMILGFAPLFDSGSAYWKKPNVEKKQRLFADQEKEAIRSALRRANIKDSLGHEEMFRLVDMYPEIGDEKRMEIKTCIISSEQEMGNYMREAKKDMHHSHQKKHSEYER